MLTIKRYPNRKFYDTEEKCYITLDDISERIREGREVQVIDQGTGEEITSVILTQIILEREKKQSGFIPRSILTSLVQAGGYTVSRMRETLANPRDLLKQINQEIENRIDYLIKKGELAEDEARLWRDKLLLEEEQSNQSIILDEEALKRLIDERGVPTKSELKTLSEQIDNLMRSLEAVDQHPESE